MEKYWRIFTKYYLNTEGKKIMNNGYWEKMFRADLTNKTYKIEDVPEGIWKMFVGGSGFGVKVLLEEVPPKIE